MGTNYYFDHADVRKKLDMITGICMWKVLNAHGSYQTCYCTICCWKYRTAQVVRKQFLLKPAATKTMHRSQGDTETNIVVNFNTRRAISHIHYVGLRRVTTIEGLFITDLCESKIGVNPAGLQTKR